MFNSIHDITVTALIAVVLIGIYFALTGDTALLDVACEVMTCGTLIK